MDSQELEKLIQAVTEEMLAYLGTQPPNFRSVELAEIYCSECNERCNHLCVHKTKKSHRSRRHPHLRRQRSSFGRFRNRPSNRPHPSEARRHPRANPQTLRRSRKIRFRLSLHQSLERSSGRRTSSRQPSKSLYGSGLPLGATLPQVKIYETDATIKLGAQEIDMVINIGALKSGLDDTVEADIRGVVEASHRGNAICKVILETALLTTEEKIRGSLAAKNAGADFVKTSTGFSTGGATAEDVSLMRAVVGGEIGIKAAGGVRSYEDFQKMVEPAPPESAPAPA